MPAAWALWRIQMWPFLQLFVCMCACWQPAAHVSSAEKERECNGGAAHQISANLKCMHVCVCVLASVQSNCAISQTYCMIYRQTDGQPPAKRRSRQRFASRLRIRPVGCARKRVNGAWSEWKIRAHNLQKLSIIFFLKHFISIYFSSSHTIARRG